MKKGVLSLLVVILILSVTGFTVFAGDTDFSYHIDNGILYIEGTGDMPDYSQSNPAPWCGDDQKDSISSVVIADTVTSIGDYAFAGCSNLGTSAIPASVTEIGQYAFLNCYKLTSVTVNKGSALVSIGNNAFDGCVALNRLVIDKTDDMPDSITSIGAYAFRGCTGFVGTMTLPASTASIGAHAFDGCTKITGFAFADNGSAITSVGEYAFANCEKLEAPCIPTGISQIPSGMFSNCRNIRSDTLALPAHITSVGSRAFENIPTIFRVSIPSGVDTVCHHAFAKCAMLFGVEIGNGSTSVDGTAFADCADIRFVSFGTATAYGFDDDSSLMSNATVLKVAGEYVCKTGFVLSDDKNFVFKDLGGGKFSLAAYIGGQYSVTLPDTFRGSSYSLHLVRGVKEVTIPAGIEIDECAFEGCKSLTAVRFASGWSGKDIGAYAFRNCVNLYAFDMPNTIETIWDYAFSNTMLQCSDKDWEKPFTVSNNLKYVKQGAFYYCYDLPMVLDYDPQQYRYGDRQYFRYLMSNDGTFSILLYRDRVWEVDNMYDVDMHLRPDLRIICDHALDRTATPCNWGLSEGNALHIPATVAYIGDYAMRMTGSEFHHPLIFDTFDDGTSDLVEIGDHAFENTRRSQGEVVLPEGLRTIGDYAFAYTWEITSFVIPSTVESIGSHAFYGDYWGGYQRTPDRITFASGSDLTTIGDYAFRGAHITEIDLPESVTSLGKGAFDTCRNLKSISIPASVQTLNHTFDNCHIIECIVIRSAGTVVEDLINVQEIKDQGRNSLYVRIVCPGVNESAMRFASNTDGRVVYVDSTDESSYLLSHGIKDNATATLNLVTGEYTISGTGEVYRDQEFSSWIWNDVWNGKHFKKLVIGSGITDIPIRNVLGNWTELESIAVEDGNEFYKTADDGKYLLSKDGKTLIRAVNGANIVPAGVEVVGNYAYEMNKMTSVILPDGLKTIGAYAFINCDQLKAIRIPDTVTEIGAGAFTHSKIQTVIMSRNIQTMGYDAFRLNYGVETLYLFYPGSEDKWNAILNSTHAFDDFFMENRYSEHPDMVYTIVPTFNYIEYPEEHLTFVSKGDGTCYVSGQEGITDVPQETYTGKYSDKDELKWYKGNGEWEQNNTTGTLYLRNTPTAVIHVPAISPDGEAVISIGDFTDASVPFKFCINLKEVYIPEGVHTIANTAFLCCEELELVDLPLSIELINQQAFRYCRSLGDMITKDHIKLRTVGQGTFIACESFVNLYIPKNLTNINSDSFQEMTGVRSIEVDPDNGLYRAEGNCLFVKSWYDGVDWHEESLILGCATSVIPQGTKIINSNAFWGINGLEANGNMTSITIPNSVETIGSRGVGYLEGLTEIIFEEGSALTSVGGEAFYFTDITEIRLPDNIKITGSGLCRGDKKLTTVYLHTTSIPSRTFENCISLSDIDLYATSIGSTAFKKCASLRSIELNEGLTYIGNNAFDSSGLVSLRIPSTVGEIGTDVFANCADLKFLYVYNPEMKYSDASLSGITAVNVTVFGHKGSTTEKYCKARGIAFIPFPEMTFTDGKASVTVSKEYARELNNCLEMFGYAVRENGTAVEDASVVFDPSLLGEFGSWSTVRILTNDGEVLFDNEAAHQFVTDSEAEFEFKLTSEIKQLEHKGDITVTATVKDKVSGERTELFAYRDQEKNGVITITAAIQKGLDPDEIIIYYEYESTLESAHITSYDPVTGLVTFATNHFSVYRYEVLGYSDKVALLEKADSSAVYYTSLSAALNDAQEGEIVRLLVDVTNEPFIAVMTDVTLDLNGHSVTGATLLYSTGVIVDSASEKGYVKSAGYFLTASSGYSPIYNASVDGYSFYSLKVVVDSNGLYVFAMSSSEPEEYKQAADCISSNINSDKNGRIKAAVELSWVEDGKQKDLTISFSEDYMKQYLNKENGAFSITFSGVEGKSIHAAPVFIVYADDACQIPMAKIKRVNGKYWTIN